MKGDAPAKNGTQRSTVKRLQYNNAVYAVPYVKTDLVTKEDMG